MSMIATPSAGASPGNFPIRRAVVSALALLLMLAAFQALTWTHAPAPAPAENPFGIPTRDVAPSTAGLGGLILSMQAQFYGLLTTAVMEIRSGDGGVTALVVIGFLYGIFHAAGPGHGKGVISAYLLSRRRSHAFGAMLCLGAALFQALVAVLLVAGFHLTAEFVGMSFGDAARAVEVMSFAAISLVGAFLLWQKSACILPGSQPDRETGEPSAGTRCTSGTMLEPIAVVVAAGIRPCTGALLLLALTSSVGLYWAGVAGAFAMAFGTAITTASISFLATGLRRFIQAIAGSGKRGALVVGYSEVGAAAFICVFGAVLATGAFHMSIPGLMD
jgi:nickel/cobalt exporter